MSDNKTQNLDVLHTSKQVALADISPIPPIKRGGLGGGKISASKMLSGGMPCEFELTMEFVCYFLFTFIIYFCVFAFVPYDNIIEKILKFIQDIFRKFTKFLTDLIPGSVKKKASSIFPKSIVKFFKKTIPKMIEAKKEEMLTPLKKKLKNIQEETNRKLNKERNKLKHKKDIISQTSLYLNEQFIKIKHRISVLWEKFKEKIIPAIIISFIYYIIWLIFFKIIPTILKYLINVAQQFKQAQM
jgi:hypothetical protein